MMEFALENFKAYIVQGAILLFTDFTTDNFWSRFPILVVLKIIFWQKMIYGIPGFKYNFTKKGAHVRPHWKAFLVEAFLSKV